MGRAGQSLSLIHIFELHDVIDQVERELKDKLGCEAVIHMDPIETDNEAVGVMRSQVAALVREVDREITIHDFRMVKGPTHTNLIFDAVVPYQFQLTDQEVTEEIEKRVQERWSNYYAVVSIDHSYVL